MLNKVIGKLFFILIITLCIFSLMLPKCYALGNIVSSADDFIKKGEESGTTGIGNDTIKNMSDTVYNVLLIIGIIVAVIVGLVIAIQFMTGSVSEKAKVKETLVPYIAGCIVLFGAFAIWKLVVTILQSGS